MTTHRRIARGAVWAVALAGWAAAAGVVIEQEQREPGSEAAGMRTLFYLDVGRLRLENQSEAGAMIIIFHAEPAGAERVWVIDRGARTYTELTPAKLAEMRRRMEEARREMAAQLAELPPEQRQALEKMMGAQMAAPAPLAVRVLGRGEPVGSFVCTHYEILRGAKRQAEVWAASPEQLQLEPKEYETLTALGRFLAPLGESGPLGQTSGLWGLQSGGEKIEGFVVRSLAYDEGRAVAEDRVVHAERRSLDPALFTLPPGLRKTELGPEE